jgi:hypothetical protein
VLWHPIGVSDTHKRAVPLEETSSGVNRHQQVEQRGRIIAVERSLG